jgi:predicted transcriptional regulator
MSTTTIRVSTEVHEQVSRLAKLCGDQPADLLAVAWREYVDRHRDDFAADLEKAASLMRNGTLDELVEFVQDAHRGVVVVDEEDLDTARHDPETIAVVAEAREAVSASRQAGRRHEH